MDNTKTRNAERNVFLSAHVWEFALAIYVGLATLLKTDHF